ncbi:MAG TPA: alpha/beta fold hydrolase [Kofleriaceae bacterium]|jgi:polyhydroxyalkanoate synthase|nr:alpha/beta fold hydrolase [Kofleriaceae bacterium]
MKAPLKKTPLDSIVSLLKRAPKGPPPVGVTPHSVVWTENKWRLLRFAPAQPRYATPIVMVPSLINRWYVLDLGPQRSLIEWLVAQGHEVFCIDWGTPGDEDRYLTWDDIAGRYVGRAVRIAARYGRTGKAHVLGYCLGGTLAVSYVAAFPEYVASLLALAAPIDFEHAGIMSQWTRTPTFDVRSILEAFGNVPWPLMQMSFNMLKPTLRAAKTVALLDRAWDDEFLEGFLATEHWGHDNVSFPGACYARYIEELYRANRFITGGFTLLGRPAELHQITCPVLALAFADDHIVPLPSASPLVDRVASSDKQLVVQSGGHVGAVVSRKAADRLWPVMHQFWAAR